MATETKSFWKQLADEAIANGYTPGRNWEHLLRKSLERSRPQLVKELGEDLDAYLVVKGSHAHNRYLDMTDQGTSPDVARELALAELLGVEDMD